ncbi:MAG: ATP-binding cassette domain-containing protein, partial [Bacillus sp. (in: firmicutes)]
MSKAILEVENLKKYFPITAGVFNRKVAEAVDDISFFVNEGDTLGIVGESGCGKSTTGRMLMRLIEPTEGKISFNGKEITKLSDYEMRKLRKDMQMVFQDPFASLNPKMSIAELIEEPLIVQTQLAKAERRDKAISLLEKVGLRAEDRFRYPHE